MMFKGKGRYPSIAVALMFMTAAQTAVVTAEGRAGSTSTFITLGTGAGPVPQAARGQPANLLAFRDQAILVDLGDGAAQQLGKANVPIGAVSTIFISHLHSDHIGGLFAFLSRRHHMIVPGKLTIYGPPGTKATVDALMAAIEPATTASKNIGGGAASSAGLVTVIELRDGWTGQVGEVAVTAVSNSHYVLQPDADTRDDTYAFRFDTPGRSIVYTGDTGPSPKVEKLASGADLLFSEIMDPAASLQEVERSRPDLPASVLAGVAAHFTKQHLSPTEVGLLAQRAGVKALVLTHNAIADQGLARARSEIAANYKGTIKFANDLDRF